MEFKDILRTIRKNKGISQEELSKRSSISLRMIKYYESKNISPPIDKIKKLAKALEVNVDELINDGTTSKKPVNVFDISKVQIQKLKKIKLLLDLPGEDQNYIFNLIDLLTKKNK